jgi:hypothetical protein
MLSVHEPYDLHASLFACRSVENSPRLWPSGGDRGSKCQAGVSTIRQRHLPLIFLFLSCFQLTLALGKGEGSSQTLSGFPHPFPAKTCFLCQTFAGRHAETLRGFLCSPRDNRCESTWFFLKIVVGALLFRGMQCGWSAATRLIMHTLVTMFFPLLAPWSNGISVNVIALGNGFERYPRAPQQKTMGTQTSAM